MNEIISNKIDNLSINDKAYMIYGDGPRNFPIQIRSYIYTKTSIWKEDIQNAVGNKSLEKVFPFFKASKFLFSYGSTIHDERIRNMIDKIGKMESFTKENIIDIFSLCNYFMNLVSTTDCSSELWHDIFFIFIPYKIKAYEIRKKITQDFFSSDDTLNSLINETLSNMYNEFLNTSYPKIMIISYLNLMNELGVKPSKFIDLFIMIKSIFGFNCNSVKETINAIETGQMNVVDILNEVQDTYIDTDVNIYAKKIEDIKLIENYTKGEISTELSYGIILKDPNFILEKQSDLNRIILLMDDIDDSFIKEYIGANAIIYYDFTENEIGCLRSHEIPMIILKRKIGDRRVVIQYKGEEYLIFHTNLENKIYGLGLSRSDEESRKLFEITLDSNYNYRLEIKK